MTEAAPQGEDPRAKPITREERIRRAHETVNDLCHGRQRWRMSIPARENDDPDLVIGAALRIADDLLRENAKLREALEVMAAYHHERECKPGDNTAECLMMRAALDPSSTGTR